MDSLFMHYLSKDEEMLGAEFLARYELLFLNHGSMQKKKKIKINICGFQNHFSRFLLYTAFMETWWVASTKYNVNIVPLHSNITQWRLI